MAALFKTKGRGKTVVLVDIESGSVGAALARFSRTEAPKLFGETRILVPVSRTRDAHALAKDIERATREALQHVSTVATRIRNHDAVAEQGDIEQAVVFLSPPWASMHLTGGTADFAEPLQRGTHLTVRATLGEMPISFHPLGTAAAHGSVLLFPDNRATLLCIVSGEVTELLVVSPNALLARATVPTGSRGLLRTLNSHAGMSFAEAHSFIGLPRREGSALNEPLLIAEDDFATQIEDAARDFKTLGDFSGIIVVAREPEAELLARALARNDALAELFPDGGVVRAVRASHAMPYIAAHAQKPDLHLMLEALFVDAKFGGI